VWKHKITSENTRATAQKQGDYPTLIIWLNAPVFVPSLCRNVCEAARLQTKKMMLISHVTYYGGGEYTTARPARVVMVILWLYCWLPREKAGGGHRTRRRSFLLAALRHWLKRHLKGPWPPPAAADSVTTREAHAFRSPPKRLDLRRKFCSEIYIYVWRVWGSRFEMLIYFGRAF
jgi:hypothetical protein